MKNSINTSNIQNNANNNNDRNDSNEQRSNGEEINMHDDSVNNEILTSRRRETEIKHKVSLLNSKDNGAVRLCSENCTVLGLKSEHKKDQWIKESKICKMYGDIISSSYTR